MPRLIRVFTVRAVPVFVHWSVLAICLFLLGAGAHHLLTTAAGLASYLGVLIVHELGHHAVARRRGYRVERIEVFPLHAACAIFGFLSPAIALLNLVPVAPLDGKEAWSYFRLRFGRAPVEPRPKGKTPLEALE